MCKCVHVERYAVPAKSLKTDQFVLSKLLTGTVPLLEDQYFEMVIFCILFVLTPSERQYYHNSHISYECATTEPSV